MDKLQLNLTHIPGLVFAATAPWNGKVSAVDEVVYSATTGQLYGGFSGDSFDDILAKRPDAVIMTSATYLARQAKEFTTLPKVISFERYMEMLEELPPVGFTVLTGEESFEFLEAVADGVVMNFVRIGNTYFEYTGPRASHSERVRYCKENLPKPSPEAALIQRMLATLEEIVPDSPRIYWDKLDQFQKDAEQLGVSPAGQGDTP